MEEDYDAINEIGINEENVKNESSISISSDVTMTSEDPLLDDRSAKIFTDPKGLQKRKKKHDKNFNVSSSTTESEVDECTDSSPCHFKELPDWLQDNNFIHFGHRPPLPSVVACLKTIFHIHTETGNIWTHLLGCVAFLGLAISFITSPNEVQEKIIFGVFFAGVIVCLFLSSAYHTLCCHSPSVGKLFNKLDYVGIAVLIMASFVPSLHYSFYCQTTVKWFYMIITLVLGVSTIIFSLYDKFAQPVFRPIRAALFIVFGLSGAVPAIHYLIVHGWVHSITRASLGWLVLMGFLYIVGALFYANRVPEKLFPGKCDIWFQSHQIFHVLVVAAAFTHYYGVCQMALHRRLQGECEAIISS